MSTDISDQQGALTTLEIRDAGSEEDGVLHEGDTDNVILEGDELFMTVTPEEQDRWQEIMQERESALVKQKEKYEQWRDGYNKRRMFAYSRVRKLQEGFKQRGVFYTGLAAYLTSLQDKTDNKDAPVPKSAEVDNLAKNDQKEKQEQHQHRQQTQISEQQNLSQQQGEEDGQSPQHQHIQTGGRQDTVTVKPLLGQSA